MTKTKTKCPVCNSESTLILNEDNFNVLFKIILDLDTRVKLLEGRLKNDKKNKNKN